MVVGDPVMDQLRFSRGQRDRYRRELGLGADERLVLVNSTWGPHATLAADPDLPQRLVAQLPLGRYRVALVQHWNISQAHSRYEVGQQFRDAERCGLVLVPPDASWQAVLVASDLVIGDHGSVTVYGVGLGKPLLLVSDGGPEVEPTSAQADLWAAARRLDLGSSFRKQVEEALGRPDAEPLRRITDRVFGVPGEGKARLYAELHGLLGITGAKPRVHAVPRFTPREAEPVGAYLVSARVRESRNRVELERFPDLLERFHDPDADVFLLVDDTEVDPGVRSNAEVVVTGEVTGPAEAERWVRRALEEYRGASVAAAAVDGGCVVGLRDVGPWRVCVGPVQAACALNAWVSTGHPLTPELVLAVFDNDVIGVVALSEAPAVGPPQQRRSSQRRTSALRGLPASR
ncbi:hypothetical protein [Actinosynnema sp. NPDC020468]|uniref:hypothetical protein n=1 Tax=Actinosynnema sp. NPDC020468 TaxID=3154488 RepID=UPI0033CBD1E8